MVQTTIGTCFNELIDLFNKGGFSDREDAMEELIKIGKPAIGSLLKIVKGKDIRSDYAVEILGNIGNSHVFDVLMTALKDWCRIPQLSSFAYTCTFVEPALEKISGLDQ